MNELPSWWLFLTGLAAVVIAIFFIVMCALLYQIAKFAKEVRAPVENLVEKVNDLVPEVKSLVQKVEALTVKVEGIAESTRGTVDLVGDKAKGVAGAVESIATIAATRFRAYAPILGAAMAGMRLYSMFVEARTKKGSVKVKATVSPHEASHHHDGNSKKGTILAHRGVEQSGSSSGS